MESQQNPSNLIMPGRPNKETQHGFKPTEVFLLDEIFYNFISIFWTVPIVVSGRLLDHLELEPQ